MFGLVECGWICSMMYGYHTWVGEICSAKVIDFTVTLRGGCVELMFTLTIQSYHSESSEPQV